MIALTVFESISLLEFSMIFFVDVSNADFA